MHERMLNTQEWQDGNIANVCTFLVALTSDTVNIFVLCYIGEYITATVSLSYALIFVRVYFICVYFITLDFNVNVISFPSRF